MLCFLKHTTSKLHNHRTTQISTLSSNKDCITPVFKLFTGNNLKIILNVFIAPFTLATIRLPYDEPKALFCDHV